MLTEQDLQSALRAFDDANPPDVSAVRARLDAADGASVASRSNGWRPNGWRPNGWRSNGWHGVAGGLAAAACIGAVALTSVVIEHDRGGSGDRAGSPTVSRPPGRSTTPSAASSTAGAPSAARTWRGLDRPKPPGYPGTTHVTYLSGVGPRTLSVPRYALPANFVPQLSFTWKGSSNFVLTQGGGELALSTTQPAAAVHAGGLSLPPATRSVRVSVDRNVTWWLSLDVQPDPRTNAAIGSEMSDEMALGVDRTTGSGTATVHIKKAVEAASPQLMLTCSGSGVRITSSDSQFNGKFTHTCFPGFVYAWQLRGVSPGSFVVHADPSTRWTVALNA